MQAQTTRERLIRDHIPVARRIALKLARRCPDWIAREDLVSAGMVGLIEAADRYDDTREEPFVSFAEHRIRGAILDELRRGDMMPRRVRQLARRISSAIGALERRGDQPTDDRVAEAIGVSIDVYRDGMAQLANAEVEPLDTQRIAITCDASVPPDVAANQQQTLERVRDALTQLAPRDVTILNLHYVEELTYQDIAATLRVTRSRVCQLLWRAVERLREQLGETTMEEAA